MICSRQIVCRTFFHQSSSHWMISSDRGRCFAHVRQKQFHQVVQSSCALFKSQLVGLSSIKIKGHRYHKLDSDRRCYSSFAFHSTVLFRDEIPFNMPKRKSDTTQSEEPATPSEDETTTAKSTKKPKLQKKETDAAAIAALDVPEKYTTDKKSEEGKEANLKIASWNVAGLRAWLKKDGISYVQKEEPDIFFVMETKIANDAIPTEAILDGYHAFWYGATAKKGYSGTGLYSKKEPVSVKYGIGIEEHDAEGRVITAEYEDFYFVGCYVPNSGRGLIRLEYRQEWDKVFTDYLINLDKTKPVIYCGDLNVAHQEIDLKNPKSNHNKTPGFTDEERNAFTALLDKGFVDSFRHLYPDREFAYSFWTYMGNCRTKNVGWRLDYSVISKRLLPKLCDVDLRTWIMGSDHCPSALQMAM